MERKNKKEQAQVFNFLILQNGFVSCYEAANNGQIWLAYTTSRPVQFQKRPHWVILFTFVFILNIMSSEENVLRQYNIVLKAEIRH